MKRYLASIILVATLTIFSGCAQKPESIAPAYVSHVGYMSWTCEQLSQEQTRLSNALSTASDAQRQARANDTAGVILLGLPVSSLSGSNQASNIARLKGEIEAVQKALTMKDCGIELVDVDSLVQKQKNEK